MNRVVVVLAAAAAVVTVAVPGEAASRKPAPRPSCLMLTDPTGDAKIEGQGGNYDVDDIVSADVATGRKTVVGVLRLKSGDTSTGLPTGSTYTLTWAQAQKGADGKTVTVYPWLTFYVYATGGTSGVYGVSTDPAASPSSTQAVDQASMDRTGVITWTLSRKAAGIAAGARLSRLQAASPMALNYRVPGGASTFNSNPIDEANGSASYTDLQVSCVRAG